MPGLFRQPPQPQQRRPFVRPGGGPSLVIVSFAESVAQADTFGRSGTILSDKRIEWSDGTSSQRMGSTWFNSDGSSIRIEPDAIERWPASPPKFSAAQVRHVVRASTCAAVRNGGTSSPHAVASSCAR